jgi:ATP-binding cassette subfamily B protein
MRNLNRYFTGKTVILVAHRLSTIKNADQILVMHEGQLVEQGNHDALCAIKGKYFNLIKNQLA